MPRLCLSECFCLAVTMQRCTPILLDFLLEQMTQALHDPAGAGDFQEMIEMR